MEERNSYLQGCKSFVFEGKIVSYHTLVAVSTLILVVGMCCATPFMLEHPSKREILVMVFPFVLIFVTIILGLKKILGIGNDRRQYFVDRDGMIYCVEFSQVSEYIAESQLSLTHTIPSDIIDELTQEDIMNAKSMEKAYQYVKMFKEGMLCWDPISGGEARVIPMENLKLVKQGEKSSIYQYVNGGKRRTVKISNDYAGLLSYVKMKNF